MIKSLLSLATVSVLAVGALSLAPPAADPVAPAVAAPAPAAFDAATFVGADACKKCHFAEHKSWLEMKHSSAWQNLPEAYRDPAKVDDFGRPCISCHVTGWGEAERGGFQSVEASPKLLGVQCEACHGPGSLHVELGQTLLKEKRKTLNEGEQWHIERTTSNCSQCHNPHISYAKKYGGG